MGQRDLRRLLITGAMAVVQQASRRGGTSDPWLAGMLARQAEDAGRSGTRQQDGAHRLGAEHEKGNLPVLRCRLTWRRKWRKERTKSREAVGRCGQDAGTGKGKRSERRDRENQDVHEGHRARVFDWIRSHEHHTGPRPRAPHQEAGHTTVPDLNAHRPQFDAKLASHGASTPSESALAMGTPPVPHFAGRLAVVCRSPERRCRSGRRGRGWERPGVSMPRTGTGSSTDGGACSLRELRAHLKYRSRLVERRVRVKHDFAVRRGGAVGLEHARET